MSIAAGDGAQEERLVLSDTPVQACESLAGQSLTAGTNLYTSDRPLLMVQRRQDGESLDVADDHYVALVGPYDSHHTRCCSTPAQVRRSIAARSSDSLP